MVVANEKKPCIFYLVSIMKAGKLAVNIFFSNNYYKMFEVRLFDLLNFGVVGKKFALKNSYSDF